MTDVFRTLIVTAAHQTLVQRVAETLAPVAGAGMFTTGLNSPADLEAPPVAYVSTGFIGPEWDALLPLQSWEEIDGAWTLTDSRDGDAAALLGALQAADPETTITLAQLEELFAASDVTTQDPWEAFRRLGLALHQEPALE